MLTENSVAPMDVTRHEFRETTERLFHGIIIIYSGIFHKKTTIEKIRDADLQVFRVDQSLHDAYQRVWQMLPDFCKLPRADGDRQSLTLPDRRPSGTPGVPHGWVVHRTHRQKGDKVLVENSPSPEINTTKTFVEKRQGVWRFDAV